MRHLAYTTALALIFATGAIAQDQGDDSDDVTLYRVFVGDHANPTVTAFDLDDPARRWSFEVTGQAKLYSVANGSAVAAVQSDNDAVHFFTSGISRHDHGDHADIEVTDPAAVATALSGPRPFHLVDHDGKVVINYDKGGYAEILDGHDLAEGRVEVERFAQARAHHGFVALLGDVWMSSVASDAPVEGDAAPDRLGLQAFNADGTAAGELASCTAIHGEAFSGAYLATGCKEGVLTATTAKGEVVYDMVEYPADLPEGMTTGTLLGSTGMQVFLGNYGADGLVVFDPVGEPHYRYIKLPFKRVDFSLDPGHAGRGFVLTEDGTLHRIDLIKAEIAASARVTEAYSMEGHWNDPRPRLALAGDDVVLSDPKAGLIRVISADTLAEERAIEVGGQPYNLAIAGGSGVAH